LSGQGLNVATYLHFAPAVALALAVGPRTVGWRLTGLGALCAVMPDADFLLVALRFDSYSGTYGHRGFTHSLGFALAVGLLAMLWPGAPSQAQRRRSVVGFYLALCTVSHPLLDGLIDVGICNAWWWPLDGARHCLPWRPVPMQGVALWGWKRLGLEALWIGVPLVLVACGGFGLRLVRRRLPTEATPHRDPPARSSAPGLSVGMGTGGYGADLPLSERRAQRVRRARAMQEVALAWQRRSSFPARSAKSWGR
jgi:inner membrane protein